MRPKEPFKLVAALILLIGLVLTIQVDVSAEENKPEPFSGIVKVEKYHVDFNVNSDGSYIVTCDLIYCALTDEGVKSASHAGLTYSTSLDETEILSACTLKKDGRRIEAPPSNIQEREAVAGGGPMFSDLKSKAIIFPDVSVGDKVSYSYKKVRKTPLFPGQFSIAEVFSKFLIYDDVRISVSIPSNSLDLHVFDTGVKGGRIEDRDGRQRWVWTFSNNEIAKPEGRSVDSVDYAPRIIASTFKDYGAVAAAYEERARPKARVTEKISALATELTAAASGEQEKARILCTWVAKNIRFAGNYMGVGSVVPHEADEVLANRLGDCKDHVAITQALLASVGIESTPVLINSGFSFKLPDVATPVTLNHVITYIPSLDLYVDTSSEYTPFGQLPLGVNGKPVVHTTNFTGVRQTPPEKYDANSSAMKMALHIHEDGSADGEIKNEETGLFSSMVRAMMAQVQPNMEDLLVRTTLEKQSFTGTGSLVKDDPRQCVDDYKYGIKFHINNALNLPGPGAIYISSFFPCGASIHSNIGGLNLPERTLDYACGGNISTEEFTIEFPKNVKIAALPKDMHVADERVSYDSTYRQEGNTVFVSRRFEDRMQRPVCTPKDDRDYRTIAREILKDLKAQLIFLPTE